MMPVELCDEFEPLFRARKLKRITLEAAPVETRQLMRRIQAEAPSEQRVSVSIPQMQEVLSNGSNFYFEQDVRIVRLAQDKAIGMSQQQLQKQGRVVLQFCELRVLVQPTEPRHSQVPVQASFVSKKAVFCSEQREIAISHLCNEFSQICGVVRRLTNPELAFPAVHPRAATMKAQPKLLKRIPAIIIGPSAPKAVIEPVQTNHTTLLNIVVVNAFDTRRIALHDTFSAQTIMQRLCPESVVRETLQPQQRLFQIAVHHLRVKQLIPVPFDQTEKVQPLAEFASSPTLLEFEDLMQNIKLGSSLSKQAPNQKSICNLLSFDALRTRMMQLVPKVFLTPREGRHSLKCRAEPYSLLISSQMEEVHAGHDWIWSESREPTLKGRTQLTMSSDPLPTTQKDFQINFKFKRQTVKQFVPTYSQYHNFDKSVPMLEDLYHHIAGGTW